MALDSAQVEVLQNSTPTDWSKFDASVGAQAHVQGQAPGGLPPGMGPGFDDKLHVKFFTRPRIDIEASSKANRPIYKDVPFVEIMVPGDKNNISLEEVWDLHKRRFPRHWEQFQAGLKDQVVGTPLRVAPFLTDSHIEELAYFKIRTLEQLATLSDTHMTFMGARELQQAAKKFLDRSKSADVLLERIEKLEAENQRLAQEKAEPVEEARKPGRPRKNVEMASLQIADEALGG